MEKSVIPFHGANTHSLSPMKGQNNYLHFAISQKLLSIHQLRCLTFAVLFAIFVFCSSSIHAQQGSTSDLENQMEKDSEKVSELIRTIEKQPINQQIAMLNLLSSLKRKTRQTSDIYNLLLKIKPGIQNEDLMVAWLLCYGRISLFDQNTSLLDKDAPEGKLPTPKQSASMLTPFLAPDGKRKSLSEPIKNAAMRCLQLLVQSATQALVRGDITAEIFEEAVTSYTPLLGNHVADESKSRREIAFNSLNNLMTGFIESLPNPNNKRITDADKSEILEARLSTLVRTLKEFTSILPVVSDVCVHGDSATRLLSFRFLENISMTRRLGIYWQEESLKKEKEKKKLKVPEKEETVTITDEVHDALGMEFVKQLPILLKSLQDQDVEIRIAGLQSLEALEGALWGSRHLILPYAKDENPFVRWVVARILGKLVITNGTQEETAPVVNALAELMMDRDIGLKVTALNSLQKIGTRAAPIAKLIAEKVRTGDLDVRLAAAYALEATKDNSKDSIDALIFALNSNDIRLRRIAAELLGHYGKDAEVAIPSLQQATEGDDTELQRNAADSLLQILKK